MSTCTMGIRGGCIRSVPGGFGLTTGAGQALQALPHSGPSELMSLRSGRRCQCSGHPGFVVLTAVKEA